MRWKWVLGSVTFHDGRQFTDESHPSDAEVLADGHLLVEDGNSAKYHGRQVSHQKSTSQNQTVPHYWYDCNNSTSNWNQSKYRWYFKSDGSDSSYIIPMINLVIGSKQLNASSWIKREFNDRKWLLSPETPFWMIKLLNIKRWMESINIPWLFVPVYLIFWAIH